MTTKSSIISQDQANACLLAHRLPESAALKAFVKPPGSPPENGWLESLLDRARKEAEARQLGAWGAIDWLLRSHWQFMVDDSGFSEARDAVPYASPEVVAHWLTQWRRPELWLAALSIDQPVEVFPALLKGLLDVDQVVGSELLAVIVKCALQAAYDKADREHREALSIGENMDAASYWSRYEWPVIANSMCESLITIGTPAVEALITEILCDYRHGKIAHDRAVIDETWHLRLAACAPKAVFSGLLLYRVMETNRGEAALEAAALITQLQSEAQSDRARQVFHEYLQIPWETWRWQKLEGHLAGLLANCLRIMPQPVNSWQEAWDQRNPGPHEGWPADLNGRDYKHAAAVHLEHVGILASLDINMEETGKPHIANSSLINAVGDAIHDRLISAAGDYDDSDGLVLQVYWSALGEEAIQESCRRINDFWVHERQWELTPELVRFVPLINSMDS